MARKRLEKITIRVTADDISRARLAMWAGERRTTTCPIARTAKRVPAVRRQKQYVSVGGSHVHVGPITFSLDDSGLRARMRFDTGRHVTPFTTVATRS